MAFSVLHGWVHRPVEGSFVTQDSIVHEKVDERKEDENGEDQRNPVVREGLVYLVDLEIGHRLPMLSLSLSKRSQNLAFVDCYLVVSHSFAYLRTSRRREDVVSMRGATAHLFSN